MNGDVVRWLNGAGCHRCGMTSTRYIPPYWDPSRRVCPRCCSDLNRLYEANGWPVQ